MNQISLPKDSEDVYKISPVVPDSSVEKPAEWADEDDGPWDPPMKENEDFEKVRKRVQESVKAAKTVRELWACPENGHRVFEFTIFPNLSRRCVSLTERT